MAAPYDVAIIGGGFSGGMLAARLVTQRRKHAIHVILIDREGRFGRGVAYSTPSPRHLLNVPAGRMSAVVDEPDHFVDWARKRVAGVEGGTYLPRTLYGDYAASVLDAAIRHRASRSTIELRVAAARRLDREKPGDAAVRLHLEDGDVLAKKVVLATGNAAPRILEVPGLPEAELHARYVHDPWAPSALVPAVSTSDVLVLGTGLTMIDVALELVGRGHRGRVIAISRRGLLPQPQISAPHVHGSWVDEDALASASAARLVRRVREALVRAAEAGADWRFVLNDMRPFTPALWKHLDERGQASFLRHAATYWESHRHRVPPPVHDVLLGLLATGQVETRAASLVSVEMMGSDLLAHLRPRGGGKTEAIHVHAIVNCTGPDPDVGRSADPLFKSLLTSGRVRLGPHHLGIDVDETGAAIGTDGAPSKRLFTLGPLRRGRLYETTAVAEIRSQVGTLSQTLEPE
jgi:uncharacterized NAD(P)/FAD-binding protein YdhS